MKKSTAGTIYHKPVLKEKVIEYLITDKSGIYIDATLGGGGHSERILEELNEGGRLLGIDRDEDSLKISQKRLRRFGKKVVFSSKAIVKSLSF